ncbi:MAG TPA: IgGFc-binding protein, partial [Candidatus Kapabacteria bacterium]|nr:IgGFc-binding protein [Candidatus Kapabacteria bacterium]
MKRIVLFILLLLPALSLAQNLNADGKDYYIGWLYPSYNAQKLAIPEVLNFLDVSVLISSYDDNSVTISYFNRTTGKEEVSQTLQVAKRRSIQVHIDTSIMRMTGEGEVAEWKSMHITAKKPIKVEFFSSGSNSGGSYLPIATNFLGKNYVVESYQDNPTGAGGLLSHDSSSGYFMVIAAFDGTTVKITPNATTKVHQFPGVNCGVGATGVPQPFNVTLQRGQCYMVKSNGGQGCDISGSTVISDKPVAVIGGHEDAFTQGSDVGTINVEGRDFMVEQMLPVEYWDSDGYFSVPFVDSKNAQGGDGDNLALFYGKPLNAPANYPSGTKVTLNSPGPLDLFLGPYPSTVTIKSGVTFASSAYDNNGVKMHVVQYDQRMQGGYPYPAPSQMSLIPMSRWKSSYLWDVPIIPSQQVAFQSYYCTIICDKDDYRNGALQWCQDGGALFPVFAAGTVGGQKNFGPNYPNLIGMSIKLNGPRSYYITNTTRNPFIVYNYSFRAIDAKGTLGDFDGDDQFFSAATAAGFAAILGGSSFNNVIDTQCAKWNICTSVSGATAPKLKSLTILNDPDEDFLDRPNSTKGYVSYNVRFDKTLDPNNKGEIDFSGSDSSFCTTLFVQNPLDSAYAAILAMDDNGNYSLIELNYKASALADTTKSTDFDVSKTFLDSTISFGYHRDTIIYTPATLGASQCATTSYFVTGDSAKGTQSVVIKSISLAGDNSYQIQSNLVLPVTLRPASPSHPADTLKLTVCFT